MRRLFWFGLGVGSTIYAETRLRRRVGEITPMNVGREAVRSARDLGEDVVRAVGDAVAEGRRAADDEERLLRSELRLRPTRPLAGRPPGRTGTSRPRAAKPSRSWGGDR